MPKVSVIIPVYNAQRYLKECLDSVINQTLKDIEIICVDDGSTDNSLAILREYAAKDNRIMVLTQSNQYAGVARNNGLAKAAGEYVYFLDADDWMELSALEQMVALIEEKKVPLIKFRAWLYDDEKKVIVQGGYTDYRSVISCYLDNYVCLNEKDVYNLLKLPDSPWTGFYNRSFLQENHIYFDPFICANDTGFWFRCIAHVDRVWFSSKRFLYHRRGVGQSLITRRAQYFECVTSLLDAIDQDCTHLPDRFKNKIKDRLFRICLYWWFICLQYPSNTWQTHDKLYALMYQYLAHTKSLWLGKISKV